VFDGGTTGADGGSGSSSGGTPLPPRGTINAPDCVGCSFPAPNAPTCSGAPAIKVVYPPDTVLVPPNMNVISVQWTPSGAPFTRYSVDFTNATTHTDWHVITSCMSPTVDAQTNTPTGGCEVVLDPASWSRLVGANRGASPVSIAVRGTTDGTCVTASTNTMHMSFAEEDLLGTYYYWKSLASPGGGVGGQIWKKSFGDLNMTEQDVTSSVIPDATCNGCHSLSRDGKRMVVYSDDADSDDEYDDVGGSLLDMTTTPATEFAGGVQGQRMGGQPPGFSTIDPLANYYVTSNGVPITARGGGGTANPYPAPVPTNGWSVWNGQNGMFVRGVPIGAATGRPTMPDWSIDGKTVVFVQPAGFFASWRTDDDHIYGGSLYTVPYAGNGMFGSPTVFLQSKGENNYYPSYSPDSPPSYVIFDRVDNMSAGAWCMTGTSVTGAPRGFCPDDSFSNPAARLLLAKNAAGPMAIDLEKANGSPAAAKVQVSNSYPRWAPFVQTYHGQKLLWFTFSSTRDYGVRVLNHKTGMYQCYPPDTPENPGPHDAPFDSLCQEPQLWMAPLTWTEAQGNTDPSGVAFWVPYQDMTTHNHTAQWTSEYKPPPPPPGCTCSMTYGPCGAAHSCGCCSGQSLICSGNNICISPPH
jgi:hypothetical protein